MSRSTLSNIRENYYGLGNTYPDVKDLSHLRKIYQDVQSLSEPKTRGAIELEGWLHYEHGLALEAAYPKQATQRYAAAANSIVRILQTQAQLPPIEKLRLSTAQAMFIAIKQEVQGAPSQQTVGVMRAQMEKLLEVKAGGGGVSGLLAELAVATTVMIPGDPSIAVRLATPRQESQVSMKAFNTNRDFNLLTGHTTDSDTSRKTITGVQVKSAARCLVHRSYEKFGNSEHPEEYAPSIRLITVDRHLGLDKLPDYERFVAHVGDFVATGERTEYVRAARQNIVDAVYG